MSPSYPHDYHPLAPLVRQLRGTLHWLEESGVSLTPEVMSPLIQRFNALTERPSRNDHIAQKSRYWASLSYPTVGLEDVTGDHEAHTQSQDLETDPTEKHNHGPLPAREFPAVLHQRSVVDSISFDQAPPSGPEAEGSAELMTFSPSLRTHRGEGADPIFTLETHSSSQESQESSFFSREGITSPNDVALDLNSQRSKGQALWATKVAQGETLNPSSAESPTTLSSDARTHAIERLKATQKKPLANIIAHDTANAGLTLPRSHENADGVQTTTRPQRVRSIGFDEDEKYGLICDAIWSCDRCPRRETPHLVGAGHYGARVMFVVGQPAESDLETRRLLMNVQERELYNGLLKAMTLSRTEVYLTSLLKCGSDEPNPHEWSVCQSHFMAELELVRPQVIVALGYVASVILLGGQVRQGAWGSFQEIDVMPTFHPRDIVQGGDTLKRQFWRQLRDVMRRVGLKIQN